MTQPSPSTPSPHAALTAALASLDTPLDFEISLYRRQRTLTQTSALVHQPQVEEAKPSVKSALPFTEHGVQTVQFEEEEASPHLSSTNWVQDLPSHQGMPAPDAQDGLVAEAVAESQVPPGHSPNVNVSKGEQSSSVRPSDSSLEKTSESFDRYLDPAIDDYLESSEGLLKHLEDPDSNLGTVPPIQSSAISIRVWGIVSVVTLLMVVCVGFVLFNTTRLRQIFIPSQAAKTSPVNPSPNNTANETTVGSPSNQPPPASSTPSDPTQAATSTAPTGPDLSSQEFVDLNLSNLGKVDPQTSPGAGTTSGVASAPETTRSFYVVSNYSGRESLNQARRIVPNAYLATFADGQRIQLATLYDFQKAKEMAQSLRDKGLDATILASN